MHLITRFTYHAFDICSVTLHRSELCGINYPTNATKLYSTSSRPSELFPTIQLVPDHGNATLDDSLNLPTALRKMNGYYIVYT